MLWKSLFIIAAVFLGSGINHAADKAEATETHTIYPRAWEKLKLKGLNLQRLEVPGGWLVKEGLGKMIGLGAVDQTRTILFLADATHSWRNITATKWELNRLKGLNIRRLKVPGGWLVREDFSKIGDTTQMRIMVFVPDPGYEWQIAPKKK